MSLFQKKLVDPLELLRGELIAMRVVWEAFARMPAKQQQAAIENMPAGLRATYLKAKAVDPVRADHLIAEARTHSPRAQPSTMTWDKLLEYAVG
jgi:hypothetical protein